ncbi:MAG TPA: hypothetical protein VGN12_02345 [Pirellulales bacterium]
MALDIFNIEVLDSFAGVEKGYHFTPELRPEFYAAVEASRRHRVPIVTLALSRAVRSRSWRIVNHYAEPSVDEVKEFKRFTRGVTVATWLRPDADYDVEHALFSNLKEDKGGRPMRKKNRREWLQPRAEELKAHGKSYRAISLALLDEYKKVVAPMTIHGWLNS